MVITLDGNSHAPCPRCGRQIAFRVAKEGEFHSEERRYPPDALIPLACPLDGKFEVPADEFILEN